MTDIEIAQAHEMKKIVDVAAKAGIDEKHVFPSLSTAILIQNHQK